MTIQSIGSIARLNANAIQNGASSITAISEATKDISTTLAGNSSAYSAIVKEFSYGGQIATKLGEFIQLVHSTASEFEVMDQGLSHQISSGHQTSPGATPGYQSGLFHEGGTY